MVSGFTTKLTSFVGGPKGGGGNGGGSHTATPTYTKSAKPHKRVWNFQTLKKTRPHCKEKIGDESSSTPYEASRTQKNKMNCKKKLAMVKLLPQETGQKILAKIWWWWWWGMRMLPKRVVWLIFGSTHKFFFKNSQVEKKKLAEMGRQPPPSRNRWQSSSTRTERRYLPHPRRKKRERRWWFSVAAKTANEEEEEEEEEAWRETKELKRWRRLWTGAFLIMDEWVNGWNLIDPGLSSSPSFLPSLSYADKETFFGSFQSKGMKNLPWMFSHLLWWCWWAFLIMDEWMNEWNLLGQGQIFLGSFPSKGPDLTVHSHLMLSQC